MCVRIQKKRAICLSNKQLRETLGFLSCKFCPLRRVEVKNLLSARHVLVLRHTRSSHELKMLRALQGWLNPYGMYHLSTTANDIELVLKI